jgi:hypothetical protein
MSQVVALLCLMAVVALQADVVDGETLHIVGLCITGQLGRVEVKTKIDMVLKHAASLNHVVDVVLALQNSSRLQFVNSEAVKVALKSQNTTEYQSPADSMARRGLQTYSRYYRESFVESMATTLLNEEYIQHLDKSGMNSERRKARARSHISQWYHMSRCWKEFQDLEYEHQFRYDSFVRLRDDAYVLAPIDSSAVVSLAKSRTDQVIVVPHCEAWTNEGMNDKAALVSRAAAHNYFVSPIDYFYLRWETIKSHHRNSTISPERFIAWCYAARKVRIVKLTLVVPIMTSMFIPGASGEEGRYCMRVRPHILPTAPNCSAQCYYEALPRLSAQIKSMLCTP